MILYEAQTLERGALTGPGEDAGHRVVYTVRTFLSNAREQGRDTSKGQNQDAPQEGEVGDDRGRWMIVYGSGCGN